MHPDPPGEMIRVQLSVDTTPLDTLTQLNQMGLVSIQYILNALGLDDSVLLPPDAVEDNKPLLGPQGGDRIIEV